MGPSVVSAVKSGAMSASRRGICISSFFLKNRIPVNRPGNKGFETKVINGAFTTNAGDKSNGWRVRVILAPELLNITYETCT